jgi:hypothetical protein
MWTLYSLMASLCPLLQSRSQARLQTIREDEPTKRSSLLEATLYNSGPNQ